MTASLRMRKAVGRSSLTTQKNPPTPVMQNTSIAKKMNSLIVLSALLGPESRKKENRMMKVKSVPKI